MSRSALALALLLALQSRDDALRRALADGLTEFASWCHGQKLTAEGRALADEALALAPDHAKAKALRPKLDGASSATESARKEFARRLESGGRKLAPLFRELFAQKRDDAHLIRAFELDGSTLLLDAEIAAARRKPDLDRAHRLLTAAQNVKDDPARARALREIERKLCETRFVVRKASKHDLQYYLALPKGWSADRKWPIVVLVDGRGCDWLSNANAFLKERRDRPFILVAPQCFSNTDYPDAKKYTYTPEQVKAFGDGDRIAFDETGILAAIHDVRTEFSGSDRFFMTGFSGGGLITWRFIFHHPEKLAAAAPACPNFYHSRVMTKDGQFGDKVLSTAAERATLPVTVFQGEKDKYLDILTPQWEQASALAARMGWAAVTRRMIPELGHNSCAKPVLDFFAKETE